MSSLDDAAGTLRSGLGARTHRAGWLLDTGLTGLFLPQETPSGRALTRLGLVALYLFGLLAWTYVLNAGDIPFEFHDWAEVTGHRYAFLRDAVTHGQLPLHMPGMWALRNVTDRFISIADTNLSPQVLLLRVLDVGDFILADTLLLYTLGFLGLLILRTRLKLGLAGFSLLWALFFFNGSMSAHLTVGHLNWAAYFLLPFLVILVLDLLSHHDRWRWAAWYSGWMFLVFLQGGFHLFVGSLLLVALVAAFHPPSRRAAALGIAFALLVSAVRILPAVLESGRFDTEFLSGFTTFGELASGLIELRTLSPSDIISANQLSPLGWWEKDYYLGLGGLAFLIVFGIRIWTHEKDLAGRVSHLMFPIVLMTTLSIGRFYRVFHLLQIPLLSSERVSTRLLAIPLGLIFVLVLDSFQRSVERWRGHRAAQLLLGTGLLVVAHDLWQHLKAWRVVNLAQAFPPRPVDFSLDVVANHPDPVYFATLVGGLGVSMLSLGFLIFQAARRR